MPLSYEGHPPDTAKGFHILEDEIQIDWLTDWQDRGIADLEDFLEKHAQFLEWANQQEQTPNTAQTNDELAA